MVNLTCTPGAPVVQTFNSSLTIEYDAPEFPEMAVTEVALKITFYVLAMLVDLVGNFIVILIILLNRKMRTTTNVFILNLAVSDLLVGMFCMWVHLGNQISNNWPFGYFMCIFSTFAQVTAVTTSVLTLTVISVERFVAIVFPFRAHWPPVTTGVII
ncbi:neuropeptide FF receptor 1-like, partial [Physella acuta]|uniref:neuropeptide FF receptor 1-like n=1 Tax=Physella acuta TaxID=109671 RepID=UPI0027DCC3EB